MSRMCKLSVCDLPDAVVMEILLELPVRTLLICKSVCKSWLYMISTDFFIISQLHRASHHNPTLVTIHNPTALLSFATSSTLDLLLHQPPTPLFHHLYIPHLFAYCRVVSSCNGIFCLSNRFSNIVYLWNPTIRKCRKIPIPGSLLIIKSPLKIGFAYDSISNDYKVLRIVFHNKDPLVPLVQLYSTIADSWQQFQAPILKNWNYVPHLQTNLLVQGVLYFDGGDQLISFDSHKDILGLVHFPSCIFRKRSQLLDFGGSVAIVFESVGDGLGIDLWTLVHVSGQVSWTRKFSIDDDADSQSEICLSSYLGAGRFYGSKLLNGIYLHNVLYDSKKKETKVYGVQKESTDTAPLIYVESLVSLDGFEQVE